MQIRLELECTMSYYNLIIRKEIKIMKKFGFTLAEVLITLGIIGVVAAITIPTLITSTSSAELKTGFKKAVSILSQAVTMNVALNDADFSQLGSSSDSSNIYGMLVSRIKTTGSEVAVTNINTSSNKCLQAVDGMVFCVSDSAKNCSTSSSDCTLWVDVNGSRGPNTSNVENSDQYELYIYNQVVTPVHSTGTNMLFN